jgi:putative transposase
MSDLRTHRFRFFLTFEPRICSLIKIMGGRCIVGSRPRQLSLPAPRTWGGKRKGAGAKPRSGRPGTPHCARPVHKAAHPVHVTLRARRDLPSLRQPTLFLAVKGSIAKGSRDSFRILHFSVQSDHLHMMVEATDAGSLSAGARGLCIRIARAINKTLGRCGRVWGDRYHARALKTPREVRNGLVYVMMNIKKHHRGRWRGLDPCSSAAWFDGFRDPPAMTAVPCPVAPPATWLAREGWRRHGLIATGDCPVTRGPPPAWGPR